MAYLIDSDDDMQQEYDFSGGVRGKHRAVFQQGFKVVVLRADGSQEERDFILPSGTVLLDPDVLTYFPDSASVNRALRGLIQLIPDRATINS